MSARDQRLGIIYGLAGFLFWGLTPLYWRGLDGISPWEIIAHRIIGAALLAFLVIVGTGRVGQLISRLRSPKILRNLAITGVLIAANWLCFVWAVATGRLLEVSIGYFMGPLVTVALGAVFLKEPVTRGQGIAVALAVVGLGALLIGLGIVPWIAPFLAVSFSIYGFVRKATPVDAVEGLFIETVLCVPIALIALGVGGWAPPHPPMQWALLALAGPVTLVPLALYAQSARRIRLTTLGFIQYVSPTCQFAIATMLFHEPVTTAHYIAFALVWAGLIVYIVESNLRSTKPSAAE